MKKLLFLTFVIVFYFNISLLHSKEYSIKGKIFGFRAMKILIQDFHGKENPFFDSAKVGFSGDFQFKFSDKNPLGVYRLRAGDNFYLDFIFNHSDISFQTDYSNPVTAMKFINSPANESYYDYLKNVSSFQEKVELLTPLLEKYPKNDNFYPQIKNRIESLKEQFVKYIDSVDKSKADKFVKKLISYDRSYVQSPSFSKIFDKDALRRSFFDRIDFTDNTMLKSELYANIIISYLGLYNDPLLGRTKQADLFKRISDEILSKAASNPQVYEFVVDFLINGFRQIYYYEVVDYIVLNNRIDENCTNTALKTELEKQIDKLKLTTVGSIAPSVDFTNFDKNKIPLHSIQSERILVVFWASWCNHCKKEMPELAIIEKENKSKLKILAVSIDRKPDNAVDFLSTFENDFINTIETDTWDSPVVNAFNVFSAPTYFLLDKNFKIIAKPLNLNELKDNLNK